MTPEQLTLAEQIREDKDRGAIKPIEPNRYGLAFSQLLRGIKGAMNYPGKLPKSVPLVGDMGLGDFVMGEGPEYMEDLAYGFGKGQGGGLQRRLDPRFMDLIGTPTFGAVAGSKLLAKQIRKGVGNMVDPTVPVDAGRRKVLGGLATAAPVVAVAPDLVTRALPKALDAVAPAVAKEAAPTAVAATARTGMAAFSKAIDEALAAMKKGHVEDPEVHDWFVEQFGTPEQQARFSNADDVTPEDWDWLQKGLAEDFDKSEAGPYRTYFEGHVKEGLEKYGEVDPAYLQGSGYGTSLISDHRFPNSPHVKLLDPTTMDDAAYGAAQQSSRNAQSELERYLVEKNFSSEDLKRMMVTGRYPEDFPQTPMFAEDIWVTMEGRRWQLQRPDGPTPRVEEPSARPVPKDVPEDPSRRGAMEKLGGLLGAGAIAATGIGVGGKLLKKTLGEVAPVVAKEAAPAAAKVGMASIDELANAAMARGRGALERYINDPDALDDAMADYLSKEDLDRIYSASDPDMISAADRELMNKAKAQFAEVQEEVTQNTVREAIEDALSKYGEIDETFLHHYTHGSSYADPLPKGHVNPRSPHVKWSESPAMDIDDLVRLRETVKQKGWTREDMQKFITTGRFPKDFPSDLPLAYQELLHEFVY